jgi:M6 family metalloprotease-like protein
VVFDEGLRAYCFARLARDGQLVSTGRQVHLAEPAQLGLVPHLRMRKEARTSQVLAHRQEWERGMENEKRWKERKAALREKPLRTEGGPQPAPPGSTTTGTKVGLTLLIDFDDDPATVARAEIVDFCNGDNYTGFGNNGSVKKYFQENSNGLLTYSNLVTVYLRIPNSLHPKSWYNDTTLQCGQQGNLLVRDAIEILKSLPNYHTEILPTFEELTVDDQNRVVACNVFYAGENSGRWNFGLWPHAWALVNVGAQELSPGGKSVYRYQITNIGNNLELGTFCHENGHLLCGYPDIYDYDSDSKGGAGIFCLMNSGGHGNNPVQVCAYLKYAAGWATITELNSSSSLLASLDATPGPNFNHFYRYQKPGAPTEYFLMESRHASGRDADLPGSGVAIWHIDELGDGNDQRMYPNTSHQNYEVTLVQADNQWDFQLNDNNGDTTDLYYRGNTAAGYSNEFSDNSNPNARWWDGSASGVSFHAFTEQGASMSFQVGYGNAAPQIVRDPQSRTAPANSTVSFNVNAVGTPVLTYQWHFNTTRLDGATESTFTIQNVTAADQGQYWVRVSNEVGSTNSQPATLTVVQGVSLADALDTTDLTWQTGEGTAWKGQTETSRNGDAAQSAAITHTQQSWLHTTIANGPGQLTFWWKVSSESNYDYLDFWIDGQLQIGGISGEEDWQRMFFSIPPGNHLLSWSYTKDEAVSEGQDCGWVDEVTFVAEGPSVGLAEALDGAGLSWTTGGTVSWRGQTSVTRDGADAGESGVISNNQDSWVQTTVANGPGTLSFWWKVSSEPEYDFLEFYIDGILQAGRIAGEADWAQQTHHIGAGSHTLRWRYAKDEAVDSGQDRAWVDELRFVPDAVAPATLGVPRYVAGGTFLFDVTGSPGARYVVLGSKDLIDWTPLETNAVPFTFADRAAAQGARVYRACPAQ